MDKSNITQEEAKRIIWGASEKLRGNLSLNGEDYCEAILEVLLWAKCIPTSTEMEVGYFDSMQSIKDEECWNAIQRSIDANCNRPDSRLSSLRGLGPEEVEQLRTGLLQLARALNNGTQLDRKVIIEALLLAKQEMAGRRGGELGCSYSMGLMWRELLKEGCEEPIACLFPMGAGVAPYLADQHQVLLHSIMVEQERWLKGILKLLGGNKPVGSISQEGGWATAIASPPWREMGRSLLTTDPWLAGAKVECPEAIKDTEARRIYAAHQLCTGKTYALVSPAIGFSSNKDIEYFRSEIVAKNWLDTVVELPQGSNPGTSMGGLLLILSHSRKKDAPIAVISAEKLVLKPGARPGREEWSQEGIEELVKVIRLSKENQFCRLIKKQELEKNGFKLQASRYLKSEGDAAIEQYIESRKTLRLSDLAEIKRPPAMLGKKTERGITAREATLSDIGDAGIMEEGSKTVQIEESLLSKGRDQLLAEGDVLLSIKGSIGRAATVGKLGEPTIPGQAFCVIRLRPNAPISPDALVQFLRSDIGQSLLQKCSQGTGVPFVPMGEVKNIEIVLPSNQEMEHSQKLHIKSKELSRELQKLTLNLREITSKGWLESGPVREDQASP